MVRHVGKNYVVAALKLTGNDLFLAVAGWAYRVFSPCFPRKSLQASDEQQSRACAVGCQKEFNFLLSGASQFFKMSNNK